MAQRLSTHISNEGLSPFTITQCTHLIGGQIMKDSACISTGYLDHAQLVESID
jgi:hypothetical protein